MAGLVVGVRRNRTTDAAVRWASAEAAIRGLPLTLVHAWDAPLDVSVELRPDALADLPGGAVSCAVHGRAAAVLLAQQPELLVLGGHEGARHVSHLTRDCLHHAACPVVVVPDTERAEVGRIVVGICGTEASRVALRWAHDEARLRGARLVVFHAWQLHANSAKEVLRPARALHDQQPEAEARLRGWVQTDLGATDVELHARHGGPLEGLLTLGVEADLLVLGRSPRTGLGKVLHGAVGDQLSGLAPCPVAVIPGGPTRIALRI